MAKDILVGFLVLVLLLGVIWIVQGNDFFMYKVFAPKYEKARREVFVNTPSYIAGKQQYLARLHFEWLNSDAGHREAICALARSEAATLDPQYLPNDLKTWECAR